MTTKFCTFCDIEHPLTESFWYRLDSSPKCKERQKKASREVYTAEEKAAYQKKYRERRREHLNAENKKWREANAEKHRQNALAWYYANKKRAQSNQAKRDRERVKTDPVYKIAKLLRTRVGNAIRRFGRKNGSAIKDLGCSVPELKMHLENQFEAGMSWDNHGQWHIDHILPLAKFDLTNPEQFRKAVHYTNLQPMWAVDNIRKGASVPAELTQRFGVTVVETAHTYS